MAWKPLIPEGVSPAQRLDILALHCDDTLRATRSLKELTADWKFFTIGCIYTYGGLDYNILLEYSQNHPDPDFAVLSLCAQRPLFTGMCPPGWPDKDRRLEHELCATPLEYWEGLRDWIAQIGLVDRKRGRYAQATMQDLEIVDNLAVDNAIVASSRPPTITIAAFGIDGTHYHIGFASRTAGPHDTAAVIKLPIRDETRRVGRALLAGDPGPLMGTLELKPANPADVAQKIREAEEKIR
jgi:hypothetical protein